MADNSSVQKAPWYALTADQVTEQLGADKDNGLSTDIAEKRLLENGPNQIQQRSRQSIGSLLLAQFKDFMIIVLFFAALISGLVGQMTDTLVILIIIFLNGIIGFIQAYRADRAVAALADMATTDCVVKRDGKIRHLDPRQCVPGDIMMLEAGNTVPADLRLLDLQELGVNESALTGESVAVNKTTAPLEGDDLALGDRINMAFKGTQVVKGRASGIVVATGGHTELGRIAGLMEGGDTLTPLQRRLSRFGKRLAWLVLAVCAAIFVAGVLRGEPLLLMFLTAVSLAVAAIPEALPAVISISLALGARKMVSKEALVRNLPAVETLGSVTYVCTDKTGTLTENRMRLEKYWLNGDVASAMPAQRKHNESWRRLGVALSVSNDVTEAPEDALLGDPTEVALYQAAQKYGFDKSHLKREFPRVGELPFDSQRQCMSTFHKEEDHFVQFVKGSPEAVLSLCVHSMGKQKPQKLDHAQVTEAAERLAEEGHRVLAVAWKPHRKLPEKLDETELTFLGLVALMDPPRLRVPEAVAQCKEAGVTPVMITGDHPATAKAIAVRVGIADKDAKVLTGTDLNEMDDKMLQQQVASAHIYARVTPQQKIRIVEALQARGEYVAMTGDGVNDAPALKRAEIGVAMGKRGTDVAREASDLVLLDDNFATIVAAIREGRRIYDNIRKFIRYTMTSNSGELWTLSLAPFFGLPTPLLPIHILWINLVTDGLPGLALALEKEEQSIMKRPPRPPQESIFSRGMGWQILVVGLLIGGLSLFSQAWALNNNSHWQTMVFTVLTFSQLVNALAVRSESVSLFRVGILSNPWLLSSVLLTVVLQLMIIYLPFFNSLFHTQPLNMFELIFCFSLPLLVLVVIEIEKLLFHKEKTRKN